jgi:hypothetical protein
MKLIFECETELGQCDADRVNGHFGDDPGDWLAFGHTTAAMTSSKGMLRIEQRCYLRSSDRPEDIRSQAWIRPELLLEPALDCKAETMKQVQQLHEAFVQKAREELIEHSLIAVRYGNLAA